MTAPDQQQSQDEKQREALNWTIARKSHFAKLDGYFTPEEFEHLLYELGMLTQWRQHDRNS